MSCNERASPIDFSRCWCNRKESSRRYRARRSYAQSKNFNYVLKDKERGVYRRNSGRNFSFFLFSPAKVYQNNGAASTVIYELVNSLKSARKVGSGGKKKKLILYRCIVVNSRTLSRINKKKKNDFFLSLARFISYTRPEQPREIYNMRTHLSLTWQA